MEKDNKKTNMVLGGRRTVTLRLSMVLLALFASMAYLLHFFIAAFSGITYCVFALLLVLLFAVSKPITRGVWSERSIRVWLLPLLILLFNYLFRRRNNAVLIDVVVLSSSFLLIPLCSRDPKDYEAARSVMRIMAVFFTVGVYLQRFLPSIYRIIIRVFPSTFESALAAGIGTTGGIKGFTTNVGFTAAYIIMGVFAILSNIAEKKRAGRRQIITLGFLLLAILLTGKRAPFLFLIMTVIVVYLITNRGSKRTRSILIGIMVILTLLILSNFYLELLDRIPFFHRIIRTIEKYQAGQDISSGRFRLYAWALRLFIRNPIFGIGWGKYRTTVVGVATYMKALETHNVYLQLLCETGIVGFFSFLGAFAFAWHSTKKCYIHCLNTEDPANEKWKPLLLLSIMIQTYFLLICLSENPLYDQFYQIIYMLAVSISAAYTFACWKANRRRFN